MWPNSLETQQLLDLACRGDADSRNQLLERHREAVRRMVGLRMDPMLRRRVDASDIVQDVLIEANARLVEYLERAKMPFHAWLRHLARDRLIDVHRQHRGARKRSVDRETHGSNVDLSNQSAFDLANVALDRQMTPAAMATHRELELRFQAALETLEDDDREIVLMRHFEQLSNQQAAEALDLSEAAAGMRYLRAMRRLRSLLEEVPARKEAL
jgi:RNA polymerase sigma-70 factor (ECF subfamily)